jgi:hypothetical protein
MMIRSVVLSMLASLWPNGSTQRLGDGKTKPGAAKALRRRGGLVVQ